MEPKSSCCAPKVRLSALAILEVEIKDGSARNRVLKMPTHCPRARRSSSGSAQSFSIQPISRNSLLSKHHPENFGGTTLMGFGSGVQD
eukprot:1368063-Rhodomonas_salina.1